MTYCIRLILSFMKHGLRALKIAAAIVSSYKNLYFRVVYNNIDKITTSAYIRENF